MAEDMAGNNRYDLVLANINKNVLLYDTPYYARLLVSGRKLILSRFYRPDLDEMKEKSRLNQLKYLSFSERNRWISGEFLMD